MLTTYKKQLYNTPELFYAKNVSKKHQIREKSQDLKKPKNGHYAAKAIAIALKMLKTCQKQL